jgi:hypothetical protein
MDKLLTTTLLCFSVAASADVYFCKSKAGEILYDFTIPAQGEHSGLIKHLLYRIF